MVGKGDLEEWVVEALKALGGSGTIIQVSKFIWENKKTELIESGDMFYEWQYRVRWAATNLRKNGKLKPAKLSPEGVWEILNL